MGAITDGSVTTGDGRVLRIREAGTGADLIVLEAGMGTGARFWGPVLDQLPDDVHIIAYDRAGYGGSNLSSGPRTLQRLADDLETVIDAHPHRRLVLVGHSWGGPVVRTAAERKAGNGHDLTGLVLVDPTDENCDLYFSRGFRTQSAVQNALLVPLARLGLLERFAGRMLASLPYLQLDAAARDSGTVRAARAMRAEDATLTEDLRRLRAAPPELGGLPVTIVSGRAAGPLERRTRAALSRAHRASAERLPGGRYVEARGSGHLVPVSEPKLIAREVLRILGG